MYRVQDFGWGLLCFWLVGGLQELLREGVASRAHALFSGPRRLRTVACLAQAVKVGCVRSFRTQRQDSEQREMETAQLKSLATHTRGIRCRASGTKGSWWFGGGIKIVLHLGFSGSWAAFKPGSA